MLYSIFQPIFRPIFRPIFNPNSSNNPPDYKDLISWTFADLLNALYSQDRVTNTDEPARFVSSFALEGTGASGAVVTLPNISLVSGKYEFTAYINLNNLTSAALFGCSSTGSVGRYGIVIDAGTLYALIQGEGATAIYRSGAVSAHPTIQANVWQKWYWLIDRDGNTRLEVNDVIIFGNQKISAYSAENWSNSLLFRIFSWGTANAFHTNSKMCNLEIKHNDAVIVNMPFSGTVYDLSASELHGTLYNATFTQSQDFTHYNLLNGFSKNSCRLINGASYGGDNYLKINHNSFEVETKSQLSMFYAGCPIGNSATYSVGDQIFITADLEIISGTLQDLRFLVQGDESGAGVTLSTEPLNTSAGKVGGTIKINTGGFGYVVCTIRGNGENVKVRLTNMIIQSERVPLTYVPTPMIDFGYTASATSQLSKTNFLCFGDSNTEGSQYHTQQSYPAYLGAYYAAITKKFRNYGISGETINQIAARYAAGVSGYSVDSTIVCVMAGTNDLADTVANITSRLQAFWDTIKGDNYELWAFTLPWNGGENAKVIEINNYIKASATPDRVIDVYGVTTTSDTPKTGYYRPDNIHLTFLGQEAVSNLLISNIGNVSYPITNSAGAWHNGAETKVVVGTNGTKDATGWQAVATVKDALDNVIAIADADPKNIFVNTTTGYCYEINVNSLVPVSDGDYIFINKSTTNKYINLVWYRGDNPPTYLDSLLVHLYINKSDFVYDDNGEYVYDDNGFIVTEV